MARCVIVLADGLRPDAVTPSVTPTLHALMNDYTHAANAVTVRPSVTVAALASLATGVSPQTHGLVEPGLGFLGRIAGLRPLARELSKGRVHTLVAAGAPAARSRPAAWALSAFAGVDRLVTADGPARSIVRNAIPHIARSVNSGFVFVYLPDCDQAGHAHGWMSRDYMMAAAGIDSALGVLAEMTGLLDDSLLIVMADHGGGGVAPTDHDMPHEINDRIPIVLAGPKVRRRYTITRDVSLLDIPATVLSWFGLDVPDGYEGTVLHDAFEAQPAEAEAAVA